MRARGWGSFRTGLTLGRLVAPTLTLLLVDPATAQIAVSSGSIASALGEIARQAHVDIGGSDPLLGTLTTRGLARAPDAEAALRRLLAETPFTFQRLNATTFRIVRRPPSRVAARPRPAFVAAAPAPVADNDIVVTGSKRDVSLADYPGSAVVVPIEEGASAPHADGQDWLLRRAAIVQSTELGLGRNKLFIRGVADSSFTGPTQSTVGTYFGDVRTGYSGPDPNLNLYDLERIEVLEGPQGALYGAGSIGGIIRLVPNAPDLGRAAASIDVGASATAHGGIGYDSAAMLNLAPLQDRIGIRAVGYRTTQAGYINDLQRRLGDINPQTVTGGRVAVRLRPLDGWTLDLGYLHQTSRQPDLQYTSRDAGPLSRRSAIAQPFEDDYDLGRAVMTKRWNSGLQLTATLGRVLHDTDQRYDATRPGMALPLAYDERNSIRLTTVEGRLSQARASGFGWLVGLSDVSAYVASSRTFGPLAASRDLVGVTNRTEEKAAFGQVTLPLFSGFTLTASGRYTDARQDGEPSFNPANRDFIRGRSSHRFDPGAGFTWRVARRLAWFGQYQQGFRTGGLAVARGLGRVATFEPDEVRVGETGLRLLREGATGLSAVAAVSVTRWEDIQADLVSRGGFPFTANVGSGRIVAFEGSLDWAITPRLRATGAVFLNHSRLDDPAPDYVSSGARPLPATPARSATARLLWSRPFLGETTLKLDANARYISHSRLGVGPVLDLRYGNYVQTGVAGAIAWKRLEASLTIDNLFDSQANRFAIGNPFGIQYRDEATPLRPRTIRLGLAARY